MAAGDAAKGPRLADLAREAAQWRREHEVPEPTEGEAMELALEAQREARAAQRARTQ
jgi:hypothetical protein